MTVTWVLESNVFAEVCFDQMVAHFKAKAIPYHVVKIIPFIHEIEGPGPTIEGPVVVYGSIGIQKLAQVKQWHPGVFGDAKTFSETAAGRNLRDLYLNNYHFRYSIKYIADNLEAILRRLGNLPAANGGKYFTGGEFFIKPDTDTKEFAGQIIAIDEFRKWYAEMLNSGYLEENDFDVVISRPKKLGCEWRVVVVDGKISDCSLYRQYQMVKPERHILPEVEAVVAEAHARYNPAPVYVIDIAQVQTTDGEWVYKVIEYNTFNSAGLYACDVTKVIDDINAHIERN
jgi:hypothetical protein